MSVGLRAPLDWRDFDAVLEDLAGWPFGQAPLVVEGQSLAQVLVHCAQGIEYTMHGFPASRPRWFQRSVGALAFAWFRRQGRMSHDRRAPLPGAPRIDVATTEAQGLARLREAIAAFRAWRGPWQPHFVYGPLDRQGHELAHAMHLADHLGVFLPASA